MKKKSLTYWRKKCVEDAKVKAKERDGYKCQKCGRSKAQGFQMHGSHNYPESIYKSMSADVENILTLCAICHMDWHENPIKAAEWFNKKYPELSKILRKRAQKCTVIDWEKRYKEMKQDQL